MIIKMKTRDCVVAQGPSVIKYTVRLQLISNQWNVFSSVSYSATGTGPWEHGMVFGS